ncbi:DUF624 domain-containing protein [Enterococcus songbeiensis]|uniref:DUF624 domain-containing protein n=1 Tax=Enterococcus songbeiensis TaxID=2559927 RepID=UPI0010F8F245|nr:DUF624 domain-containing protein [Enterococcus songbeiensis]
MIEKIFSFDGWYYRIFSFLANLIIVNILFLMSAMTVILTGPSLIAFYQTIDKLTKHQEGSIVKTYFTELINALKKGFMLTITLICIIGGGIGSVYLLMENLPTLGFLAVIVMTLIVLYETIFIIVFARFPFTFKKTLRETAYILLSSTAHGIVLLVVPVLVLLILGKINLWLCVIVGFGLSGWLQTIFFNKVLVDNDGK